jgi:ppGpp synthetase/RelA/SpoT-type nucleotidyltranferase
MDKDQIIEEYLKFYDELDEINEKLEFYLKHLISSFGIKTHSVNSRVKSIKNLDQKISRPDKNYKSIHQVTDLVALRVIIYSEDLIEDVAKIIEGHLDVDFNHSTNKLYNKDFQKFGYRSMHYVCHFPDALVAPKTLKAEIKFEIQIRTILQHTWAEIEHQIGYKTCEELPALLRRRLSQVSSLLEIADREFVAIKNEIKSYELVAKKNIEQSELIEINQLSIKLIIDREEVLMLDQKLSRLLKITISEEYFFTDYLLKVLNSSHLNKLNVLLKEISLTEDIFTLFSEAYFEFAKRHLGFDVGGLKEIKKGYSLLFVAHLSVINLECLLLDKINRLTNFYFRIDYPNNLEEAKRISREMISFLKTKKIIHD